MSLAADISITCDDKNRRGGFKYIYLSNETEVASFTAGTGLDYTAVTMVASEEFYRVEFDNEGAGLTSEGATDNGSTLQNWTLTLSLPKIEATKAANIQDLFGGCRVIAVAQTFTGDAIVLGYDEVLGLDAAGIVSVNQDIEAEIGGNNGYTITITGQQAELFYAYNGDLPYAGGTVTIPE